MIATNHKICKQYTCSQEKFTILNLPHIGFLCYLDSDEILLWGSLFIENKGLIFMLLCKDFIKLLWCRIIIFNLYFKTTVTVIQCSCILIFIINYLKLWGKDQVTEFLFLIIFLQGWAEKICLKCKELWEKDNRRIIRKKLAGEWMKRRVYDIRQSCPDQPGCWVKNSILLNWVSTCIIVVIIIIIIKGCTYTDFLPKNG